MARTVDILYLSETLVAVDKPAGIIVHGDGTDTATLTDLVRAALADREVSAPSRPTAPDPAELQALNRLDRETSGVVLFSRTKATQAAYDRLIAERGIEKRYLAVVAGRVPWRERSFRQPIGRDRHDARRMRVSRTGKPAATHARVLAHGTYEGAPCTLLDVHIETGRKHQIRVHLAAAGYPILGDELYGARGGSSPYRNESRFPAPRSARRTPHNEEPARHQPRAAAPGLILHAANLRFTDPVTSEPVDIVAPTPQRIRALFPDT